MILKSRSPTDCFPKLRFILSVLLSMLESKTSKLFDNEKVKHGQAPRIYFILFWQRQRPHTAKNNKILKYNRNPKLLGVTLDEKLNFGQHILNIEKKAGNSLRMLREIKGLGQIKTKFVLQIYNSLIGSVLQYVYGKSEIKTI